MEWDKESLEAALNNKGWPLESVEIQDGVQFRLLRGATVNLYRTGRIVVGGPVTDFKTEVESLVNAGPHENGTESGSRPVRTAGDDDNLAEKDALAAGGTRPLAADFPELHVDIQVHIDPAATTEQIDQIFASMARHLYGRGS